MTADGCTISAISSSFWLMIGPLWRFLCKLQRINYDVTMYCNLFNLSNTNMCEIVNSLIILHVRMKTKCLKRKGDIFPETVISYII
jgi:hypothetical protein